MKRKAIPQWIREALEKREKQKQKKLAKQQGETSTPDEEQKDVKVDVKEEIKEEVEEKKPFFKIKKVRVSFFMDTINISTAKVKVMFMCS